MKAVIALLICGLGVVYPACDPGWTQFKENCIWFSNTQKIWTDAELDCRKHNAWLMTDDNEDKHNFISDILYVFKSFHFNHFFIGGNDVAFENQWRWLETGIHVGPFSKWGAGEPDGNNSKNCLSLKWQDDRNLVWSDETCGHISTRPTSGNKSHVHGAENYICEKLVSNGGSMVVGRR
ncbi:lactose-binding lectin l-2-like [Mizuhopecten yessoensis]|uniref:Brevican core protein n=1 Tax=Mizuhopecten yessoensis TaxID=6573 RepID=A0A210PXB5_MIZYE|nr:lactose-binding lectin l-2-like [Mizuhopecten yessoensis]OWF41109.1 Brevican core protein [Mizuhopecten yessoensis]